jgi:hypothetical protein
MLTAKQASKGHPMKVKIKSFDVDMDVKSKGVEFQVHDNAGEFKGDCYVTMTGLNWCEGKTTRANGVHIPWDKFMKWAEKQG